MYSQTSGDPTYLVRITIQKAASRYTQNPIEFDHRSGQHGAWEAMKQLEADGLVIHKKARISQPHQYNLTRRGFQFCYHLFQKPEFPNVIPGKCTVLSDGTVLAHGEVPPRGFMAGTGRMSGGAVTAIMHQGIVPLFLFT